MKKNNWATNLDNTYSTWNYRKVSKNSFNKYSAGILPYTFDQQGKCLFLLGKDHDGDWSDFGGRCEYRDKNDEKNTACREFYEETLGAVMNINDCLDKILNGHITKIVSKTLNGNPYYMYLLYIDHQNYSDVFIKISNFLKYQCNSSTPPSIIEKVSIRWVNMDTLLNCIDNIHENPITLRGVFHKTIISCKEQLVFLCK
jgi:hypothetical protein